MRALCAIPDPRPGQLAVAATAPPGRGSTSGGHLLLPSLERILQQRVAWGQLCGHLLASDHPMRHFYPHWAMVSFQSQ
jgi:hypothetical protein